MKDQIEKAIDIMIEQDTPEAQAEDQAIDDMLTEYKKHPVSLWMYTDLPIKKRMALAYLAADNFMGAPFQDDQVRRFCEAIKMVKNEEPDLFSQIRGKDKARGEYLDSLDWELGVIPFADCAVYPHFGGFPREWSYGNILDTAKCVADASQDSKQYDLKIQDKLYKLLQLSGMYATACKFLPPIVVEGGIIRADREYPYKVYSWDIDDGNHRFIAAALQGETHGVAFLGHRTDKTPENIMAMQKGLIPSREQEHVPLEEQ